MHTALFSLTNASLSHYTSLLQLLRKNILRPLYISYSIKFKLTNYSENNVRSH